jgi:hypothetical protein
VSTDITKGPRLCPSCGRENALTATHCSFCFSSLDQGVQSAPSPRSPVAFTQQPPFHRFVKAPLWNPGYTGVFLFLICLLFGMGTCGSGFLLLIVLAPTLYRLHRADQHVSADYDSLGAGCAAWSAGAALALLIAGSAFITFGAVCFPIGAAGSNLQQQAVYPWLCIVGATLGLLAATAVAYVIVRAIFPPHDPRNSGGPRPSPSDED